MPSQAHLKPHGEWAGLKGELLWKKHCSLFTPYLLPQSNFFFQQMWPLGVRYTFSCNVFLHSQFQDIEQNSNTVQKQNHFYIHITYLHALLKMELSSSREWMSAAHFWIWNNIQSVRWSFYDWIHVHQWTFIGLWGPVHSYGSTSLDAPPGSWTYISKLKEVLWADRLGTENQWAVHS